MAKVNQPKRRSNLHEQVYNCLREIYPNAEIKEEASIKSGRSSYLLDIYLPRYCFAIEVQGQQHTGYNRFFHGGQRSRFVSGKKRDAEKAFACQEEGIELYYVFHDDTITREFIERLIQGGADERHYPQRQPDSDSSG